MRNRMKIGLAAASFAALGLVAAGGGLFTAAAQTEGFSEGQVKSIEKIVKDYLLSHPEVLTEVQDAYERKVEAQRADVDPRASSRVLQSAGEHEGRARQHERRQRRRDGHRVFRL